MVARPGGSHRRDDPQRDPHDPRLGLRRHRADSVVDLTDSVDDEELTWIAPADGDHVLFAFWLQGACHSSSPAVETSYCINYFDRRGVAALAAYLEAKVLNDPDLVDTIRRGDVQMFMDSLELTSSQHDFMFWSESMAEEFRARRGYDIRPYLPLFIGTPHLWSIHVPDHGFFDLARARGRELRARIRNDLYELHTQLVMENVMRPLKARGSLRPRWVRTGPQPPPPAS